MATIQLLAPDVAELIAAGEVVERPASIVKELVENSIDAGATQIAVEIKGGGIGYIRVTDNGHGIAPEQVPLAFQRHATSKVLTAHDLDTIGTLGFRGEALASIAAVSKVEITSKTNENIDGVTYSVTGEEFDGPHPAGVPDGTTLIIRDVFYNVPARMKFLRRDVTEGNAVAQVVNQCALSHPEIAFTFIRDTSTKLRTSGNGDLRSVVATVYSRELAADMLPVEYTLDDSIHVTGLIGLPSESKPSRTYQNFFINNRYVRTRTCGVAVEQAYKGKIMTGRFPTCILNIDIDPSEVDPNVHPAKIEVRFTHEKPIFNAVYYAVKSALATLEAPLGQPLNHVVSPSTPPTMEVLEELPEQQRIDTVPPPLATPLPEESSHFTKWIDFSSGTRTRPPQAPSHEDVLPKRNTTDFATNSAPFFATIETAAKQENDDNRVTPIPVRERPSQAMDTELPLPINLRQIGELFDTYIVLEQAEEMVLVDKHAAHERLLYEEIRANAKETINRQVLLSPIPVTLQQMEYDAILEHLNTVHEMGFLVEDFGTGTLLVRETPIVLDGQDVTYLLSEIAGKLINQQSDLTPEALEDLFDSIACKTALRAGDKNHPYELRKILHMLVANPHITHCPHGRPIVLRIAKKEIEKMFGRLGP